MRTNYTEIAKQQLGDYVHKAGKSFLEITAQNVFDEPQRIKITPDNLIEFYRTQANNLSSGIRTLAGLSGDWRCISALATVALDWFKQVNVEAIRRAGRKAGLIPKF